MRNLLYILVSITILSSCDLPYEENPNNPNPSDVPTYTIFNDVNEEIVSTMRDSWFGGRFTHITAQYWGQTEYTEEDRYLYRESMRETWDYFYFSLEAYRQIILLNDNEETKASAALYGANVNQIASSRIMMAWIFNTMADTWGDIPYWSYSTVDEDFDALDLTSDNLKTTFAPQSKVYPDLLKQLQESVDMIDENQSGFTAGDVIYAGDMQKWKRFANSLILRIALKVRGVYPEADSYIATASTGAFESNEDNAVMTFEANSLNGSPMQKAYATRSDFGMSNSFVDLLQGVTGPFGVEDPRLTYELYCQHDQRGEGLFTGVPYGVSSNEMVNYSLRSLPAVSIIAKDQDNITAGNNSSQYTDGTELLMSYAEVCFILSELDSWSDTKYREGVVASLEQWSAPSEAITSYVSSLAIATEESVLTQKYIALYMDSNTSWSEYRRTGFPKTLTLPNSSYNYNHDVNEDGVITSDEIVNLTFTPLIETTDLPKRMEYPSKESTLNGEAYLEAVNRLTDGDNIISSLWWDVN